MFRNLGGFGLEFFGIEIPGIGILGTEIPWTWNFWDLEVPEVGILGLGDAGIGILEINWSFLGLGISGIWALGLEFSGLGLEFRDQGISWTRIQHSQGIPRGNSGVFFPQTPRGSCSTFAPGPCGRRAAAPRT